MPKFPYEYELRDKQYIFKGNVHVQLIIDALVNQGYAFTWAYECGDVVFRVSGK